MANGDPRIGLTQQIAFLKAGGGQKTPGEQIGQLFGDIGKGLGTAGAGFQAGGQALSTAVTTGLQARGLAQEVLPFRQQFGVMSADEQKKANKQIDTFNRGLVRRAGVLEQDARGLEELGTGQSLITARELRKRAGELRDQAKPLITGREDLQTKFQGIDIDEPLGLLERRARIAKLVQQAEPDKKVFVGIRSGQIKDQVTGQEEEKFVQTTVPNALATSRTIQAANINAGRINLNALQKQFKLLSNIRPSRRTPAQQATLDVINNILPENLKIGTKVGERTAQIEAKEQAAETDEEQLEVFMDRVINSNASRKEKIESIRKAVSKFNLDHKGVRRLRVEDFIKRVRFF